MLRYLSADIICSEKQTVFWERSSKKTVSYEDQIMSIICSKKRTVFQEQSSCKTVSYEGQIMSADKYRTCFRPKWRLLFTYIFSCQMEAIVYVFLCQMAAIVYLYHDLQKWRAYACLILLYSSFLYFGGVFNETIIPPVLGEYEMIRANSALRALLVIYHLISNACSWNNC